MRYVGQPPLCPSPLALSSISSAPFIHRPYLNPVDFILITVPILPHPNFQNATHILHNQIPCSIGWLPLTWRMANDHSSYRTAIVPWQCNNILAIVEHVEG